MLPVAVRHDLGGKSVTISEINFESDSVRRAFKAVHVTHIREYVSCLIDYSQRTNEGFPNHQSRLLRPRVGHQIHPLRHCQLRRIPMKLRLPKSSYLSFARHPFTCSGPESPCRPCMRIHKRRIGRVEGVEVDKMISC